MSRVTSVRLSEDLATQVDSLAAALARPKSWVIEQALTRYVAEEAWQVQAISEAMNEYLAEAATGHVEGRDFDEVMNDLATKFPAASHQA